MHPGRIVSRQREESLAAAFCDRPFQLLAALLLGFGDRIGREGGEEVAEVFGLAGLFARALAAEAAEEGIGRLRAFSGALTFAFTLAALAGVQGIDDEEGIERADLIAAIGIDEAEASRAGGCRSRRNIDLQPS